uniref:Testis cDNA clone: QtsA-15726, similar to human SA hypertension-associated homolog (rat) (SAH) n=1 Tax=Macaca fascicularis TaxID=9541 RepID=Q4R3N4_MACFA|nr:unnamed protein product [Macaca fascicularis]
MAMFYLLDKKEILAFKFYLTDHLAFLLIMQMILQKQLQLYEAISISLGTEGIWMKMGIFGLLQDQTISYYPLVIELDHLR